MKPGQDSETYQEMASAKSGRYLRDGVVIAACVTFACAALYGAWYWYQQEAAPEKKEEESESPAESETPTPRLSKESLTQLLEQSLKNARRALVSSAALHSKL